MMKLYLTLFIVIPILADKDAAKTPEETLARIESHHKECSKSSHVDPQVLSEARKGDLDLTNEALIKHILCFVRRADLAIGDEVQRPVIKAKLEAQLKDFDVQKGMDGCDAEVKKEGDFAMYFARLVSCYYKKFPDNIKIL